MRALSLEGRNKMGVRVVFLFVFAIGALISGCALNEPGMEPRQLDIGAVGYSRALSVEVSSDGVRKFGSASWVSSELVITASHLFLNMPEGSRVRVGKSGSWVEAEVVAIEDPAILDLAILRINNGGSIQSPIVRSAPVLICKNQLQPAQEVVVISEFHKSSSRSYGSPDYVNHYQGATWTNHLTGHYPEGTSGGALYEVESGCLAGVVSRRSESHATGAPSIYSTTFITAKEISQFLLDHEVGFPGGAF